MPEKTRINLQMFAMALRNIPRPVRSGEIFALRVDDYVDHVNDKFVPSYRKLPEKMGFREFLLIAAEYRDGHRSWLVWEFKDL